MATVGGRNRKRIALRWACLAAMLIVTAAGLGADRAFGATFTVNSTLDTADATPGDGACDDGAGNCTLRAAIMEANALAGPDRIAFNIPGPGPHTISPASELPYLWTTVTIDGTTQPGTECGPSRDLRIVLDGSNTTYPANGFLAQSSGGSTIKGLAITNWPDGGIELYGLGGNTIVCNNIGVDATGMIAEPNAEGIGVYWTGGNIIGGPNPADRNIIGGHPYTGVYLFNTSSNTIAGNYIGVGADGVTAIPNAHGIRLWSATGNTIGGNTTPGTCDRDCNVVANSTYRDVWVLLGSDSNTISGNYVGLTAAGTVVTTPGPGGIAIEESNNNIIGGTTPERRNVVGGHTALSIGITGSAETGSNCTNTSDDDGDGSVNDGCPPVGAAESGAQCTNSLDDDADGVINDGCPAVATPRDWTSIPLTPGATGNQVVGNYVGVSPDGMSARPSNAGIVAQNGASGNTVGGSIAADRNIISGNTDGIDLTNASSNTIAGNYIGVGADGVTAVPNVWGMRLWSSTGNTIGGTTTSGSCDRDCNVVRSSWIDMYIRNSSDTNTISGNFIGLDAAGASAAARVANGIGIEGSSNNIIGGLTPARRNVIGGDVTGITISGLTGGASGNQVVGNYVGLGPDGVSPRPNGNAVTVRNGASDNVVGGATTVGACTGPCNLLSGNMPSGIGVSVFDLNSDRNRVQGNWIGLDALGAAAPNGLAGIAVFRGAGETLIGGTAPGTGNVVTANGGDQIGVAESRNTTIQGNRIGTNAAGTAAMATAGGIGVWVTFNASTTQIGGTDAAARNIISGNGSYGVRVEDASDTGVVIQGNYIGLGADGTTVIPNFRAGVNVHDGLGVLVGGPVAGAGNVITSSGAAGIWIELASNTTVQRNRVGTDANGTPTLPGVIQVALDAAVNNRLSANLINGGAGLPPIVLGFGNAPNDPLDADTGPNNLQNSPMINAIQYAGTSVSGSLSSAANTSFQLEFFAGPSCSQPLVFLGSAAVVTDGLGAATFTATVAPFGAGDIITATATDPAGNTSELSSCASSPSGASGADASSVSMAVTTTASSVHAGADVVPIGNIPVSAISGLGAKVAGAPLGSIELRSSPLGSIPLGSIPLGSIQVNGTPLGSIPLGSIPLGSISWPDVLAGTVFANMPVDALTLTDLFNNPVTKAKLDTITLKQADVLASSLRNVSLGALALGSLPLGSIGVTCPTPAQCTSSLLDAEVHGAPLGSIDVGGVPLGSIPLGPIPLGSIPLGSIPLGSIPLGSIPLGSIPLGSIGLASSPLGSIPLGSIQVPGGDFCAYWSAGGGSCLTLGVSNTSTLSTLVQALQVRGTSLASTPLGSIPLGSIPLGSIPLGSIPLGSIALSSIAVNGTPLGSIPLGSIPLGSIPLGSIPLGSIPLGSIPLGSIPLGSIPLGSIPLGSIPLGSINLAGTPLGSIPLGSINMAAVPGGYGSMCELVDAFAGAGTCLSAGLTSNSTLLQLKLALQSVPLGSIPLGSIPLGSIPLGSIPLGSITLADLDLASIPLGSIPLGSIPLGSIVISGTPLGSIPLGSIPLGSIPLGSIGSLVNCDTGCPTGTIGDAVNAGRILPGVTIADIAATLGGKPAFTLATIYGNTTLAGFQAQSGNPLGSLHIGDLAGQFGSMNVQQLIDAFSPGGSLSYYMSLFYGERTFGQVRTDGGGTGTLNLGQVLRALIGESDYPWEELPLDTLGVTSFAPSGAEVPYKVNFSVVAGTPGFVTDITIDLPPGFVYKPGTASYLPAVLTPTFPLADTTFSLPDPVVSGQQLKWSLVGIGDGSGNGGGDVKFVARPGLKLGVASIHAVVSVGTVTNDANGGVVTVNESFEPQNDTPTGAPVADPDTLYVSHISSATDVDYYKIHVPPAGAHVSVFLSNLGSDVDLVMYSPVVPPLRSAGLRPVPLQGQPVADQGAGVVPANQLPPELLQDIAIGSLPVKAASTQRSIGDESIDAISLGEPGDYILKVAGYNGAFSSQPYVLRVKVTPAEATPICTPRIFPFAGQGVAGPAPAAHGGVKTLVITNTKRLGDSYGAAAAADVMAALARLNAFVSSDSVAVAGEVISVDSLPEFAAWDLNPCDPNAANAIVTRIGAIIDAWHAASPDLSSIVIVGSDEIIPQARLTDATRVSNEADYATTLDDARGAIYGALVTRHFLSDDPYGDFDPIPWFERQLYMPDVAVGRLVETPPEIIAQVDQFGASQGFLDPHTALVTAYDFLTDGGQAVRDALSATLGAGNVNGDLISPDWTSTDLAAKLLGATPPGIASVNAHYDHYRALPADQNAKKTQASLFSSADVINAGLTKLTGSIIFTMGCHAGLSLSDLVLGSGLDPRSQDWAQTYARENAVLVANSGYGYGDTATVALSERLMALFAKRLDKRQSVGLSLMLAKQDYFAGLGLYGVYDEKALQEAGFFGLPMYRIGQPSLPPPAPVIVPSVGTPGGSDPVSRPFVDVTINPSLASTSISGLGTFYSAGGSSTYTPAGGGPVPVLDAGTQVTHYRPIEPRLDFDVTQATTKAHGALILGLQSTDITIDPVFAQPVIDLGASAPEPAFDGAIFPTRFQNITTFTAPDSPSADHLRQNLVLVPGQFFAGGPGLGTQRNFASMQTRVYYSTSGDYEQPTLRQVDAEIIPGSPNTVNIAVVTDDADVSGPGDVKRVVALVLDASNHWQLVELSRQPSTNRWVGSAPVIGTSVDYVAQAVDANGNVAVSSNKGTYFHATTPPVPPPPAPGRVTIDLLAASYHGFYIEAVGINITSDPGVEFEFSIDGAPFARYDDNHPPFVETNGVHLVRARASNGAEASVAVPVKLEPLPIINVVSPVEGRIYATGQRKAASYACSSGLVGILTCSGTMLPGAFIDTATPGSKTFAIAAKDNAGRTVNLTVHYTVQDACSITPTITGTTKNETLRGTAGNDVIRGGGGNDVIIGNGGDDIICTGAGNDKITTGNGDSVIYAGDGSDVTQTGDGNEVIFTGTGNDRVTTGKGDSYVDAGDGNDRVVAGNGSDTIYGGNGDDDIIAGGGDDFVYGGAGDDEISGGKGNDTIDGGPGIDECKAGGGINIVTNCESQPHEEGDDDLGEKVGH